MSATVRALGQRDFDGYLLNVAGVGSVAVSERVDLALGLTHSRVDVPGGRFATNVWSASLDLAFTTQAAVAARVQYNELDERLTSTARLQWSYRPGSDVFVGFQDGTPGAAQPDAPTGPAVILKVTWLTRL